MRPPKSSVVDTMLNVISVIKGHWKCLQGHETYRAGDDNKDVEGPIYVPEIVYEGAPYLMERESNKESYDPKDFYWKHSEEDKKMFMMALGWDSKWIIIFFFSPLYISSNKRFPSVLCFDSG